MFFFFFFFFFHLFIFFFFFFFFSSRRRHTRWNCDWSSDVCSSDLGEYESHNEIRNSIDAQSAAHQTYRWFRLLLGEARKPPQQKQRCDRAHPRSEERRVGKECRSRWTRKH